MPGTPGYVHISQRNRTSEARAVRGPAAGGFGAGGDSGSVIWRSRDRAPVALLFAGSETGGAAGTGVTFATPLATVLAALGVAWCAG